MLFQAIKVGKGALLLNSGDLKSEHLKSGLFEGQISNGLVFKWSSFSYGFSYSPNHSKTGPFEIRMFLSGFQMVFNKMEAICPDFKWLGFCISGPIRKSRPIATQPVLDHSKSRREWISDPPLYMLPVSSNLCNLGALSSEEFGFCRLCYFNSKDCEHIKFWLTLSWSVPVLSLCSLF